MVVLGAVTLARLLAVTVSIGGVAFKDIILSEEFIGEPFITCALLWDFLVTCSSLIGRIMSSPATVVLLDKNSPVGDDPLILSGPLQAAKPKFGSRRACTVVHIAIALFWGIKHYIVPAEPLLNFPLPVLWLDRVVSALDA